MLQTAYHPSQQKLADYALGTLAPGMELLVSGHLTFCAKCRGIVERFETVGGALLDEDGLANVSAPSLEDVFAELDAPDDEPEHAALPVSKFPVALQQYVSASEDNIDWSFRLPGMYEYEIDAFEDEKVSLLKAKPGSRMLSHTHEGEEATLILSGEMADGDRVFRKGDVAFADESSDHNPHIIGNETCICLIVMSGKLKFTGTVGRALNVLMR